jgi:1,4-dihydroxy-6-naphthoate synthase
MQLSLAFSPCPNDTYIFDAMVHQQVDTEGLHFDIRLADVEQLNRMVMAGTPDISKISYGLLPRVLSSYRVLDSGGALGRGVGPLLIAAREQDPADGALENLRIALPGQHTTAHMLFSLAYPQARQKVFMPFHEIEEAVIHGNVDAGVIIHENRFTYADKGLFRWADLGEFWETQTGYPIPLGGIVMRRDIPVEIMRKVDRVIRRSLEFARAQDPILSDYVCANAREMDTDVMKKHIALYVNDFSLSLGGQGRAAVWKMLEVASLFTPMPANHSVEVFL